MVLVVVVVDPVKSFIKIIMHTAQYFKDTATMLWKSYHHVLLGDAVADDIRRWYQLGTAALTAAHYFSRTPDLRVADKRKLEASVGVIRSVVWLLRDNIRDFIHESTVSSDCTAAVEGAGIAPAAESVIEEQSNAEANASYASTAAESVAEESDLESEISDDGVSVAWNYIDSAFENRIKTAAVTNRKHLDFSNFMSDVFSLFTIHVNDILKQHNAVKIDTVLAAEYVIEKDDGELKDIKYFNTKSHSILSTTNLKEWFILNVEHPLNRDMEEFQEQESGWSLKIILNLTININKFNPMRGSSYIPLPDVIVRKKACVNVINHDNECFKWAILSALHPVQQNRNRVSSYYQYKNELNFNGIEFPVDPRQVGKFEKQNDVSVNVYFMKKEGGIFNILPRHLTAEKKTKHVNLLLLESYYVDENEEENAIGNIDCSVLQFHYVWIKDLSRLVGRQLANHVHKMNICDRCLHYFWTADKLSTHAVDCQKMNQYKVVLPHKKNNTLTFKNYNHKNRVPLIVYGDFECLLKPVENDERAYQRHEAYSVGFFVKCSFDDTRSIYRSYRQHREEDETPAAWFVKSLHALALELEVMYKNPKPMRELTVHEKTEFERANTCHICSKLFEENDKRVRDHCHFTGEYALKFFFFNFSLLFININELTYFFLLFL